MQTETHDVTRSTKTPDAVDNTDWLKTAAIILVAVDHIGYFFIENALWWSVLGRLAAPAFFFLLGYAQTRSVPLQWIWLGIILTLLDSWNTGWAWVAPNILLSLAFIRIARPHVQLLLQRRGWAAFAILVCILITVLPVAAKIVDYGVEGWLWALFGLYQRMHIDGKLAREVDGTARYSATPPQAMTESVDLMRMLACFVAAVVYIWQEQMEFSFSQIPLGVFIFGVGVLSLNLCLFQRGPSRIQPPDAIADTLRFIGRRTLEIYTIQLAGSELVIRLVPGLAL